MASNENHSDKSNGTTNGALQKSSEVSSLLPHLESIDRLLSLPVCNITWTQSQAVYGKVKG